MALSNFSTHWFSDMVPVLLSKQADKSLMEVSISCSRICRNCRPWFSESMVAWCLRGPGGARVVDLELRWEDPAGERGFAIR